jgi:Alpha/beta hydrolase family
VRIGRAARPRWRSGHSYGGAVITEAGTHPNVAALVYIAAFAPDKGESVNSLLAGFPADAPQPPILPPRDGFLFLDRDKFPASFAADLAAFMADAQVPWSVGALGGAVTEPAWRTKPSWYLVATEDRMIPPPAQHTMAERIGATLSEVAASHGLGGPASSGGGAGVGLCVVRRRWGRTRSRRLSRALAGRRRIATGGRYGAITTNMGRLPTLMSLPALLVAVLNGITVLEPVVT